MGRVGWCHGGQSPLSHPHIQTISEFCQLDPQNIPEPNLFPDFYSSLASTSNYSQVLHNQSSEHIRTRPPPLPLFPAACLSCHCPCLRLIYIPPALITLFPRLPEQLFY